ncbi:MAG: T9SS type A sorting domain-containing protein [Fluviicola sp.]
MNLSLTFTGLNDLETIFSVAPNPTTNLVTITTQEARFDAYTLMDAQGRIIQEGKLKGTSTLLDLSRMARGNYFLQIGHQQTVLKLVKE